MELSLPDLLMRPRQAAHPRASGLPQRTSDVDVIGVGPSRAPAATTRRRTPRWSREEGAAVWVADEEFPPRPLAPLGSAQFGLDAESMTSKLEGQHPPTTGVRPGRSAGEGRIRDRADTAPRERKLRPSLHTGSPPAARRPSPLSPPTTRADASSLPRGPNPRLPSGSPAPGSAIVPRTLASILRARDSPVRARSASTRAHSPNPPPRPSLRTGDTTGPHRTRTIAAGPHSDTPRSPASATRRFSAALQGGLPTRRLSDAAGTHLYEEFVMQSASASGYEEITDIVLEPESVAGTDAEPPGLTDDTQFHTVSPVTAPSEEGSTATATAPSEDGSIGTATPLRQSLDQGSTCSTLDGLAAGRSDSDANDDDAAAVSEDRRDSDDTFPSPNGSPSPLRRQCPAPRRSPNDPLPRAPETRHLHRTPSSPVRTLSPTPLSRSTSLPPLSGPSPLPEPSNAPSDSPEHDHHV